ncbi:MAG: hypothetical protein J1F38_07780 [Muribaculaceae bacterium]|nr:hypothetical protein [Muribaculaceae bacterium]
MDELCNMKAMWVELNERVSSLEEENRKLARKVINQNFKSTQEKLVRKYSIFIALSLIMVLYMPLFVCFSPFLVEKYKLATIIYWVLFFLLEAGVDIYLRYRISNIDIYKSSISDIAKLAAQNWRIHKIGILIGVPLAFGAVILFGLLLDANIFLIYGMIVGGVIGFIVGLSQLKKFYENYKFLQSQDYME